MLRASLLLCAVLVSACGSSPEGSPADGSPSTPEATLLDRRTETVPNTGLASINGTYGSSCSGRAGAWSLEVVAMPATALDHPLLSVVEGDLACVLAITSVRTVDGQLREAQMPVTLSADASATPVAFGYPPLYVSASISTSSTTRDAQIRVVYSDSASLANDIPPVVVASYASTPLDAVAAPDYAIDIQNLTLQTDVNNIVLYALGDAFLSAGAIPGLRYTIAAGRLTTFSAIDTAYLEGSAPVAKTIPASAFLLLGTDLTAGQVRTLIIARVMNGVRSYQVFVLSFTAG